MQLYNPPTFLIRPVDTQVEDLQDILIENHGTKRSHSPDSSAATASKSQRTEEEHSCLFADLVSENGPEGSLEILIASFLQKKMQKELHHSNNPPHLQEKIDASKTVEWITLRDEKKALAIIPPHEAKRIRTNRPDRIMTSRFVIVENMRTEIPKSRVGGVCGVTMTQTCSLRFLPGNAIPRPCPNLDAVSFCS